MISRSGRSISNHFLAFREKPSQFNNNLSDMQDDIAEYGENVFEQDKERVENVSKGNTFINTLRSIEDWNR
jgi:hypothetical protein